MAKKKKQSKLRRVIGALNPTNPKGMALLFALIFALSGAGVYLYQSFAATSFVGSRTHIPGQVFCSRTFNNFNGNGYANYRDANGVNHYITFGSPNYDILLYCGSGGAGQVEYRDVNTGVTKVLWKRVATSAGLTIGAGDIGLSPLPGGGFTLVFLNRVSYQGVWSTELGVSNFAVNGNWISGSHSVSTQNSSIMKVGVTSLTYDNALASSGKALNSHGKITQANGVITQFDTHKD